VQSLDVLIPGDLESRTGGYGYDRRMIAGLRARGWSVAVHALDGSFPSPTRAAREHVARTLAGLDEGAILLVDGLAFGAMADEADHERARLRLVALVHHPLAAETGLDPDVARLLADSERRALAAARLVVVTSRATAISLEPYGVPHTGIVVVEPGTDRRPVAQGSRDGSLQLLCVASVVPRKGYDTLIDALEGLRSLDWRLTCVGSLARHPDTVNRLRTRIDAAHLADRVTIEGELDQAAVAQRYDRADLFVLPTLHEGYGMAVAEALAHGVPIISTPTGAIPDLAADGGGLLVRPGDRRALADALFAVMTNPGLRQRLRAGAMRTRDRLPTWDDAAGKMSHALDSVVARE
jgi:glycosyltransferase involved in cell wall biosynthesis